MKIEDLKIEDRVGGLIINDKIFNFVQPLYKYVQKDVNLLKLHDLMYEAFYAYEYDFDFESFQEVHNVNDPVLFGEFINLFDQFREIGINGEEMIALFDELKELGIER